MKAVLSFVILSVILLQFSLVKGDCFGDNARRQPEQVSSGTLDSCCWYSASTCCAFEGNATYLEDIQNSLNYFVEEGISEQCYYSLANLECILCNPEQSLTIQYQGERVVGDISNFFNHNWILRICQTFCNQIYSTCKDPTDAAILGASTTGDATAFCESINMQGFVANQYNVTGIFYGSQILVSQFDCFGGVDNSVIEANVGTCLTPYTQAAADFEAYYENQNEASVLNAGFILTALFFLTIWV